jgi:predicted phosphoribosyltransferase
MTLFEDRTDAAKQLAIELSNRSYSNPLILGLARGGVETAFVVADQMGCPMSVLIVRKLGHPHQPEAAVGALAEDESLYLDPHYQSLLSPDILSDLIEQEKAEIDRRIQHYRHGNPLPSLRDKTIILVDDGIATGATVFAAIKLCKKQHPQKIVVAAPVSGVSAKSKLQRQADEVVILTVPHNYFAVSQVYKHFSNLNDDQVTRFLDLARQAELFKEKEKERGHE